MKGQTLSTHHPTTPRPKTGTSALVERLRENVGRRDPGHSSGEVTSGDLTFGEPQLEQE